MKTRFLKAIACFLSTALILTSASPVDTHATATKTVTVKTQAALNKALGDKAVTEIVIKTQKQKKLYIGKGDYSDKQLVVNSPKATISNKGSFSGIVVEDARAMSDSAKGNNISIKDTNGLKLYSTTKARNTKISIDNKGAKAELIINNKYAAVNVNAKADIKIDGNTKSAIVITTDKKAAYSKIEVDIPVSIKTPVKISLAINEGAVDSKIVTTKSNVSVTVTNKTDKAIAVYDNKGKTVEVDANTSVSANATKGTTKKAAEVKPIVAATPTPVPTKAPTAEPTKAPTKVPTSVPTVEPTETPVVTEEPTKAPVITAEPTRIPTVAPTATPVPTKIPVITVAPTATPVPTRIPTVRPTAEPTKVPTTVPTVEPTKTPTATPTAEPTKTPTTHEHVWQIDVKAKDADCLTDGCTEGKHCTVEGCTEVIKSQVIEKLGHDMLPVPNTSKLNTCTEDGKESDYKCSRCDFTVEGAIIPKTGHTLQAVTGSAVVATCTENGKEADMKCTGCDYTETGDIIEALGHTEVTDDAVEATCIQEGLTEGSHCSVCNTIIIKQESIKALGHNFSTEHTIDKEATCTEKGSKSKHCSRCNATTDEIEIPVTEHTPVAVDAKAATCIEEGYEAGTKCSVCDTVITGCEVIPATGEHEWVVCEPYIEASCTIAGRETLYGCLHCDEKIGGETIPATGHDMQEIEGTAKEPTCTEAGKEADKECVGPICDDYTETGATIPALGHNFSAEYTIDKEATCTEAGSKSRHCSRCDATTDEIEIPATGVHVWEKENNAYCEYCHTDNPDYVPPVDPGENPGEDWGNPDNCNHDFEPSGEYIAATCTEDGCEVGRICTHCGYVEAGEVIKALGHDFSTEYTIDKEATCTEKGSKSKHCSRCNATTDVTEIPALGHDYHYSNNGSNHIVTCNRCDYNEYADHSYGSPCYYDETYHVITCEDCGNEIYEGHEYDEYNMCNHCGYMPADFGDGGGDDPGIIIDGDVD